MQGGVVTAFYRKCKSVEWCVADFGGMEGV